MLGTGLFSALPMTAKFSFENAPKDLSGPEFAVVMQRLRKITRTHPLNYATVLTPGFTPIAVLVMRMNLYRIPGVPAGAPIDFGPRGKETPGRP